MALNPSDSRAQDPSTKPLHLQISHFRLHSFSLPLSSSSKIWFLVALYIKPVHLSLTSETVSPSLGLTSVQQSGPSAFPN